MFTPSLSKLAKLVLQEFWSCVIYIWYQNKALTVDHMDKKSHLSRNGRIVVCKHVPNNAFSFLSPLTFSTLIYLPPVITVFVFCFQVWESCNKLRLSEFGHCQLKLQLNRFFSQHNIYRPDIVIPTNRCHQNAWSDCLLCGNHYIIAATVSKSNKGSKFGKRVYRNRNVFILTLLRTFMEFSTLFLLLSNVFVWVTLSAEATGVEVESTRHLVVTALSNLWQRANRSQWYFRMIQTPCGLHGSLFAAFCYFCSLSFFRFYSSIKSPGRIFHKDHHRRESSANKTACPNTTRSFFFLFDF